MTSAIAALLADARRKRDRARALGCYEPPLDWCSRPHEMSLVPPSARATFLRHDPEDPAWHALLASVGMRYVDGRYVITPPAPCGHRGERNTGRDQLSQARERSRRARERKR